MNRIITLLSGLTLSFSLYSQYHAVGHRSVLGAEVPVSSSGNCAVEGKTYVLVNDLSSEKSTLFLGRNVTLDLNGFTVRYADGKYGHIPNSGFEDGLAGWDLSNAPGAKLQNTDDVHVFMGKKLLSLQAGFSWGIGR